MGVKGAEVKIMVLCLVETIYSLGCCHVQHKYLISQTSRQESDVLEVENPPPQYHRLYLKHHAIKSMHKSRLDFINSVGGGGGSKNRSLLPSCRK